MSPLDTLAARELACLHLVGQQQGLMEVLDAQLEALGVYAEYQAIHVAYAGLLTVDATQEALKRAVFIQWYSLSEPSCFSGIGLLDAAAKLRVFTYLEQLLQADALDAEMACMLRYYAYWDYAFDQAEFQHLAALQTFVRQHVAADSQISAPPLRIHDMPARGGMGHYWLSWGGGALLGGPSSCFLTSGGQIRAVSGSVDLVGPRHSAGVVARPAHRVRRVRNRSSRLTRLR